MNTKKNGAALFRREGSGVHCDGHSPIDPGMSHVRIGHGKSQAQHLAGRQGDVALTCLASSTANTPSSVGLPSASFSKYTWLYLFSRSPDICRPPAPEAPTNKIPEAPTDKSATATGIYQISNCTSSTYLLGLILSLRVRTFLSHKNSSHGTRSNTKSGHQHGGSRDRAQVVVDDGDDDTHTQRGVTQRESESAISLFTTRRSARNLAERREES